MLSLPAADFEGFSLSNLFCTDTDAPVLIVDSDRDSLAFMSEILKACGCWALTASCTQSALQIATTCPPALVLLELMLPETDGIALTRRLRQQGSYPIVAVTSLPRFLFQIEAAIAGCNEYIEKPVDVTELIKTIKRYLKLSSFFSLSE